MSYIYVVCEYEGGAVSDVYCAYEKKEQAIKRKDELEEYTGKDYTVVSTRYYKSKY